MRTIAKTAVALALVGAVAIGMSATAQAQGYYYGYPQYHYGGWRTWNGCPPDWTIQGGVCKPYRHGPWDYYSYNPYPYRYYRYRYW